MTRQLVTSQRLIQCIALAYANPASPSDVELLITRSSYSVPQVLNTEGAQHGRSTYGSPPSINLRHRYQTRKPLL